MAKTSLHISIPEPCHEDWGKMTPTQCGAFCNACQKEVVDFSQMSEAEIVERLSTASGKVCGRIASDKLDRELVKYESDAAWYSWKKWAVAAGVLLGVSEAQATNVLVNDTTVRRNVLDSVLLWPELQGKEQSMPGDTVDKLSNHITAIRITGTITGENNLPMQQVKVSVHNTSALTKTDSSGHYSITVEPYQYLYKPVLIIAELGGFITMTQSLRTSTDSTVNFIMRIDEPIEMEWMGQIVTTRTPKQKIAFAFRRFGWMIDRAFRKPANR